MAEAPQRTPWMEQAAHRHWLLTEGQRLLTHYRGALVPHGFAALGNDGKRVDSTARGIITARMVHCYALANLMGIPGARALAEHGIQALLDGPLRDGQSGGWFADAAGPSRKDAYLHAFIALAGASASMARCSRGETLMRAAMDVIDRHFWSDSEAVLLPSFSADWSAAEAYRGANCNMHGTEACLALADASGDVRWLDRALALVQRFAHELPAKYDGRLPEHFDSHWAVLPDYGAEQRTDSLRPYGLTPGHFAEWAGLLLKVEAGCIAHGREAPVWLLGDALNLFDSALRRGWAADGQPGMVYTLDWQDKISVSNRPYWVQAEVANTALMLLRRTGESRFEEIYREVWDYIATTLIDYSAGGWRHEVDAEGNPSGVVYPNREDLYHDFQATLTPLVPVSASLAGALRTTCL